MIEIFLFFLLIGILAWQRNMGSRISRLEEEVVTLRAALAASPAAQAETSTEETSVTAEQTARSEETSRTGETETETAPPDPWAQTRAASAIFGGDPVTGAPPQASAVEMAAREAIPPDTEHAATAAPKAKRSESVEDWLGARWAVWVGGLALALGGIFLIKYSIESGLLSPAVRLTLAGIFGLALIGAGETIRRKATTLVADTYQNAMIPGVLTAAGTVTLFGVTYAAHGIYGFIGPASAFVLLGIVALATVGLSLLHGQALAGLGLLGSMLTPALVASTAPNIPALFTFLTIAWLATSAAARIREWTIVPALGSLAVSLWAMLYMFETEHPDFYPVTLCMLALIAGSAFLWPGSAFAQESAPATSGDEERKPDPLSFLSRPPLALTLCLSLGVTAVVTVMLASYTPTTLHRGIAFAAIIGSLAALGASRTYAPLVAILAAFSAVTGSLLLSGTFLHPAIVFLEGEGVQIHVRTGYGTEIAVILVLGAAFAALGFAFLRRFVKSDPSFSALWSGIMAGIPVTLATISFLNFGVLGGDWLHGLYGIALGLVYLAGAEWLDRAREDEEGSLPQHWLVAGSFAAFAFALHALTSGLTTTILLPVLGFAYVMATRIRPWPALPWMMVAASVLTFARIAWEPTLVGPDNLGTTPVFNALLAGYGIPAALAVAAAWELRHWPGPRVRHCLQAIASLMTLLTVAILVRHAMNGGVLNDAIPTLGEQSIYTLLVIGFSGVMMTLDAKAPSPIFRYGSMVAGVVSMVNVLSLHFFALNPYFSGEMTGAWPFFNLLLIGYLLPGLAYAGLAYYARGKRPQPYVILLALSGAALGFAWATLSVRRFWQGESIASWKGFLQSETYTYSVVWLLIGVALLALGSRFDAKSLRLASAGLVLIAVVKVFLIDMANLEGILRALSFIGLGAVLIGIGLFYQKILSGKQSPSMTSAPERTATETE